MVAEGAAKLKLYKLYNLIPVEETDRNIFFN